MKIRSRIVLLTALACAAVPAMAQFQKPEDAVKYRQSAFSVMASHFGRLGAMASGKAPYDAKLAQENAAVVEFMSKLPWAGFTPSTEGVKSKAKPEVWMDKAKFDQGAEKMVAEVAKLNTAAKAGNLDALKAAFGETAKTCKACHDAFRE
ncbi:c-type cytochrome [Hydrogenophaga soli]